MDFVCQLSPCVFMKLRGTSECVCGTENHGVFFSHNKKKLAFIWKQKSMGKGTEKHGKRSI